MSLVICLTGQQRRHGRKEVIYGERRWQKLLGVSPFDIGWSSAGRLYRRACVRHILPALAELWANLRIVHPAGAGSWNFSDHIRTDDQDYDRRNHRRPDRDHYLSFSLNVGWQFMNCDT